jgi:hypothetical protein
MKLSELDPKDIEVVDTPKLKLSSLKPEEVEIVPEAKPEEQISQTEAGLRGALQGATFGFGEEISGGLETVGSAGEILKAEDSIGKMKELYKRYRDIERQRNKLAEEAHPYTYGAGSLVGGIGSTALTGGLLGAGVKGAAAAGALTGLGTSEAETLGETAKDVAVGGTVGALAGKAGEVLGKLVSPSALKEEAALNVANALKAKGMPSQKEKIGRAVLESKALSSGINEEALGKLAAASSEAEDKLQNTVLKTIKDRLSSSDVKLTEDAGDKVYNILQKSVAAIEDMSSGVQEEFGSEIAPKVQDYILKLKRAGNDPVRLNEIKRAAYKEAEAVYDQINKLQRSQSPIPKSFEDWGAMAKQIGETVKGHIEHLGAVVTNDLERGTAQDLSKIVKETNYQLGGLAGAKKALYSKLNKDDTGLKLASPLEYAFNPQWSLIKDIAKNLGSDTVRLAKAGKQDQLANLLTKSGIGEKAVPLAKNLAKAAQIPGMVEGAQKLTGSKQLTSEEYKIESPATISQSLYNQPDDRLKEVALSFSTDPNLGPLGRALNEAIETKNVNKKNSTLFSLAQRKDARDLLKKRGLLSD